MIEKSEFYVWIFLKLNKSHEKNKKLYCFNITLINNGM